jgi:hypothetical protein
MNGIVSSHSLPLPAWARRGVAVPALLAILVGLGAFSLAPSAHAAARTHTTSAHHVAGVQTDNGTVEGCPLGDVCVYPVNAGWNGGHPEARGEFYTYGVHVLQNEFNAHYVLNNQTGRALAYICLNANGTGCGSGYLCSYVSQGSLLANDDWVDVDLTSYNSIVLAPPKSGYC